MAKGNDKKTTAGRPDDHYLDVNELFIPRSEAGEVLAVDHKLPGFGLISVLPMTQGEIKSFRRQIGDSDMIPAWLQADLLNRHIHRPVLGVGPDDLDNAMLGFAPARLIEAIFAVSGFSGSIERVEGGQVRVDFDQGN